MRPNRGSRRASSGRYRVTGSSIEPMRPWATGTVATGTRSAAGDRRNRKTGGRVGTGRAGNRR